MPMVLSIILFRTNYKKINNNQIAKKTILITNAIVISGMLAQAQTDVIYLKNESLVFNCTIDQIKENTVYYTKNDSSFIVKANAVIMNDLTIKLKESVIGQDKGRDYYYYNDLYEKYKRKRNRARGWTITSIVMFGAATGIAITVGDTQAGAITAGALYTFSFFSFNIGVPSWAANGAKTRANRKAMERTKHKYQGPKEIAFGGTSSGVGMIIKL